MTVDGSLLTVHGVNSQQSTVNRQHHSGVTGNDITGWFKGKTRSFMAQLLTQPARKDL
ncbi:MULTISPECIES: hypothetical protein [unclassified Microcoleus]|uniref:hypothetical protein n=1 Tax=unclassified Microcoleus TaxID=2642155 RepID=UPI002FD5DF0C